MTVFELIALTLTISAVLGFINHRFFKLPTTIGIMLISLGFSLILILMGGIFPWVTEAAEGIVNQIDFEDALLNLVLNARDSIAGGGRILIQTRLIRADEPLAALPVVLFSVKHEFYDKVHGMQEGAQDYITKPFEVDELLSRVRQIFDSLEPEDPTQPRTQPVP